MRGQRNREHGFLPKAAPRSKRRWSLGSRSMAAAGHLVERVAPFDQVMGHAGAIVHDVERGFQGASDPRSDGAAIGGTTRITPGSSCPSSLSTNVVRVAREGDVAVVTVENPPVNALSAAVRAGLLDAIERADTDPAVSAIIIACAGRTFIAGADIREFGKAPQHPPLALLIARIESCSKPIVAAIHGTALGGGLELAMGCHARIAEPTAAMGLPEVSLGLIPGAGGTQRLPRLIGVAQALRMIVEGKPVPAQEALRLGLIDAIASDLAGAAQQLAARLASENCVRRTRELSVVPSSEAPDTAGLFEAEVARLATRERGFPAPLKAVDAVRAAVELPFDEGMSRERAAFEELVLSPESKALRHVFFAERRLIKPQPPAGVTPRGIASAAVIGGGTMGQGIALCFAEAGIPVTLIDTDAAGLARAETAIRKFYDGRAQRGMLTRETADARIARIERSLQLENAAAADIVVEAVFEDLTVKQEVFRRLDDIAKPHAVLASNTSYLDLDKIAEATRRPQDVVGLHFFSPAHIMKLLEVVRGAATSGQVFATVLTLAARLGKFAVPMRNCFGFTGNRMLAQRTREAYFLLEEGATPWQVDRVLQAFGFPMGPFAMADLAGLDIGWRNRRSRLQQLSSRERGCDILDQLCQQQRFGQKSGRGFYVYDGERRGVPDPQVEQLIVRHSALVGRTRRAISDQEILERCLYAMVNEAARILDEGIVEQARDVDLVWLHGYGFPRYRGGPLFWADRIGAPRIVEAIGRYGREYGAEYWTPAPLLTRMAREGRGFYDA
jgi:3-hydroxyacyl-CoA dehydrogenase